jgi:D-aminopeptidase
MFTTAYDLPHTTDNYFTQVTMMHETAMNTVFRAVTEVVEESILSSLMHAPRVEGWNGSVRESLRELRDCKKYVSR